MRTRALVSLVGLLIVALGSVLAAPEKASPDQVEKLIGQLGSKSFAQRERAMQALDDIGRPALEALRKAMHGPDSEVRRRATELVERIEKRGETGRILEATRVHLIYKDTPVAEAVADFARKSGYSIVLEDPKKVEGRKLTLDTGDTTFWQAFDQFCAKARLVEFGPRPGAFPGGRPVRPPGRGAAAAVGGPLPGPAQAPPPGAAPVPPPLRPRPGFGPAFTGGQIVLTDGKPVGLPTCYSGAVRVRALPPGTPVMGPAVEKGEIQCVLEAYPEPKLPWLNVVSVQLEKAVDDQGQTLSQSVGEAAADGKAPDARVAGPMIVARPMGMGGRPVALRLKKGDKESRTLKELKGSMSAQMRTSPQPYLTVDKILKAAGRTVKSKDGGSLKVLEVGRDDKDRVTLRVEMEIPSGIQPAFGLVATWREGTSASAAPPPVVPAGALPPAAVPGGVPSAASHGPVYCAGLAWFDAKGKPLPLTATRVQIRAGGNSILHEYTFMCQLAKDQAEPQKLAYFGTRLVGVDIAFTLADVPLR